MRTWLRKTSGKEAHAAGLKQSYPADLQTHEQENQHLLWKIHCLKSDGSRTHQMVQDSSCDYEIHSPPWGKKMYLGCKQKCYLLITILKPDNKKLVTLVPTGKTGMQGQFFPPHEADHSWSLMSNPCTRLIRPEEHRILPTTNQPRQKCYWTQGRCDGTGGCLPGTAL